jgi:predicted RNase H-like HicB family nuclease
LTTKRSTRRRVIHAILHPDSRVYTAQCVELAVVTQGRTLDEVVRNLNEAIALYLEDEDLTKFGLSTPIRLQLRLELPLNL